MLRKNHLLMEENNGGDGGAGGGGGGNTFSFPENWTDYLPDDIKGESSLGVIKDIPSLAKSYVHAQKSIGAGKVVLPTKHSTDADWKKFFTDVGVPEKLDDYLSDMPAEKTKTEFFKQFKEMAHGAGLLPQQSKKLLEWYDKIVDSHTQEIETNWKNKISEAETSLKKEWGTAYKDKLAQSDSVVKELNEKLGDGKFVKMLEETGLGNDPRFAQAMVAVAELIGEDRFEGNGQGTGGSTRAQIEEKIKAYQGDFNGPYYNSAHPNHKSVVEEVQRYYQSLNPKN